MSTIYADNSQSIGNTPLVKLNHIVGKSKATILAKVEGRNPAYSVKPACRCNRDNLFRQSSSTDVRRASAHLES